MTTDVLTATTPPAAATTAPRLRLWLPLGIIALYWVCVAATYLVEIPTFYRFITHSIALAVVILTILIWWAFNRRIAGKDRLLVLAAAVAAPVVAMLLADRTMGPFPIFSGLPILFTAWALWLLVARNAPHGLWKGGLIAVLFLSIGVFTLFRMEGLRGAGDADLKWRWSQSAEDRYLAQRSVGGAAVVASTRSTSLQPRTDDWPAFRGPNRDGVVRGISIETDWNAKPPQQVWRRPIGPGWSSMIVVDGRLFTQEQRGENEAVVCLDAATGSELWSQETPGRFWDSLSSTGPRATPTFAADGFIYAQGATGTLLCLDAATGKKRWSRDILVDADAKLPDWGIASSPLVTHGLVIVYAGGKAGRSLLAYHADSGRPAWTANAGEYSYSSAHLATLAGREQVMFISDKGMISVDPPTGKTLWEYPAQGQPPRSLQPLALGDNRILVSLGMESATELIDITRDGETYSTTKRWSSRHIKPSFNDYVVHGGHLYGFDVRIFTCIDLQTGKRTWKEGRYGTGQVLLLADQGLLLVLSDQGQVTLLAANPATFEERAQFQAITGKTWNHPAFAHGRLYLRNAAEIACYELTSGVPVTALR